MVITDHLCIPFFTVSLDIVGLLPRPKDGSEYILTMQDQFTKFSVGVPLKNQTALLSNALFAPLAHHKLSLQIKAPIFLVN